MERVRPVRRQTGERVAVEDEAHPAASARFVLKLDGSEMFLDDLLDDREAEPGALGAGGHIGLGEAAALGGKADAAVVDLDRQPPLPFANRHGDGAAAGA